MTREEAVAKARILKALIELSELSTIMSTFMPAFLNKTVLKSDGLYYLYGNFNLGGTKSGRLSSSDINLQNLPSTGSKYAKRIKKCFQAGKGWLLTGADFLSLEDRISALTTKDPNKLKVYTDGYDGHCLRAYSYFKEQMPDIVNTLESINSIESKYPKLRQKSKGPTFALTYQGTFIALMGEGFPKDVAKIIESRYHELYAVSDAWVQQKMIEASKVGYTTVAFGLRLRTPILAQTILGTSKTPYEAIEEGRTMGNAQGQSYGMLNNRAAIELRERLKASEFRNSILSISHIHDAQYFLIRDDVETVEWLNTNLVECMQWQDLPDIQHDTVKLGGELDIFYPSWASSITIKNGATKEDIMSVFTPVSPIPACMTIHSVETTNRSDYFKFNGHTVLNVLAQYPGSLFSYPDDHHYLLKLDDGAFIEFTTK